MKDKQVACLIIIMAISACFFGILKMQNKLQEARESAQNARSKAETARSERVRAVNALHQLRTKTKDEMAYYETWKPYFEAHGSHAAATEKLLNSIRTIRLNSLSENSEVVGNPKDEIIKNISRTTLTFEDRYAKLFNWLGSVESGMHVARISNCKITKSSGESDIRMELQVDFPLMAEANADNSTTAKP